MFLSSHGRTKDLEVSRGFWENQSLEFSGAKPAICIVLE